MLGFMVGMGHAIDMHRALRPLAMTMCVPVLGVVLRQQETELGQYQNN